MGNIFVANEFIGSILSSNLFMKVIFPIILLIFFNSVFTFLDKKTGLADNKYYTPRYALAFFEPIAFLGILMYGLKITNMLVLWFLVVTYIIFVYISANRALQIFLGEIEADNFLFRIIFFRKICFTIGLLGEIPEETISRLGEKKAKQAFYRIVPMVLVCVLEIFVFFMLIDSINRGLPYIL